MGIKLLPISLCQIFHTLSLSCTLAIYIELGISNLEYTLKLNISFDGDVPRPKLVPSPKKPQHSCDKRSCVLKAFSYEDM